MGRNISQAALDRFQADLGRLIAPQEAIGIAVSGGPDSLALLLLAHASHTGPIACVTVDHSLRPESADEARFVQSLCRHLEVPHDAVRIEWPTRPSTALQERARQARYARLGQWAEGRSLHAVLTGHHADDQAETLLMRLVRGAGVRGLAGMRPSRPLVGHPHISLLRPLLGWRRAELQAICEAAGVTSIADPGNSDARFERSRIRDALAQADWLKPDAVARSAGHLAAAEDAILWATVQEWSDRVAAEAASATYRPRAPLEIQRRVVARIIHELASEGPAAELRGRELDRLLQELTAGQTATLRGVRCSGGEQWSFARAPDRKRMTDPGR